MEKQSTQNKDRILSLDLFRGMTVIGMILVNNPGSWSYVYSPLKHAEWNGCTPTDLVFPFFLFAVGASIPISLYSKNGINLSEIWIGICTRSVNLILLGLFLNYFGEWSFAELRIPGVLQRIGFVYWVVASLCLVFPGKKVLVFLVPILLIHTWILTQIAPPGESVVSLEQGKDIGAWIDRTIFGEKHLWRFSKTWDPEGFLSGVASVVTTLFGVLCGFILFLRERRNKILGLGILFSFVGLLWDRSLPMNKSLWTGSYAIYTAGLSFLSIWFFEYLSSLIISKGWNLKILFQPFLVFGKNAVLVFVGSGILARTLNLWTVMSENGKSVGVKVWFFSKLILITDPYFASLLYAVLHLSVWWGILSFLDKRKIYIKV
ncbi:PF07786 family protein [Leptospira santarosai]|uniref:PF07786 family protein n=1 Tax=Leptospira santarosai TaxID=28183 RepID=A0A2P1QNX3_9LEPT|nr:PF07786 family protein [Leptospira santarosai]